MYWVEISDAESTIPARLSADVVDEFKRCVSSSKPNRSQIVTEPSQRGERISKIKSGCVAINKYKPFLTHVPTGKQDKLESAKRLALHIDCLLLLGSEGEPVIGFPVPAGSDENVRRWVSHLCKTSHAGCVFLTSSCQYPQRSRRPAFKPRSPDHVESECSGAPAQGPSVQDKGPVEVAHPSKPRNGVRSNVSAFMLSSGAVLAKPNQCKSPFPEDMYWPDAATALALNNFYTGRLLLLLPHAAVHYFRCLPSSSSALHHAQLSGRNRNIALSYV